jgi:hypothetical protein
MRRKPERQACLIVGLFLLFGLATPGAYADPIIVPGFTVTDLGGGTPAFSSD